MDAKIPLIYFIKTTKNYIKKSHIIVIAKSSYSTEHNPLVAITRHNIPTHTHTPQMKRKCVQGGMKMELRGENAKESTGRERGGRKCPRPDTLNEL